MGANKSAGLTKAARRAGEGLEACLRRLDGEKHYGARLVAEGALSSRDLADLRRVHRRLTERAKSGRRPDALPEAVGEVGDDRDVDGDPAGLEHGGISDELVELERDQ